MPITLKTTAMQYKNSFGQYVGVNSVSERTTEEIVAEVNNKGVEKVNILNARAEEVMNSIPQDYTNLSNDVDGLKSALDQTENILNFKYFSTIAKGNPATINDRTYNVQRNGEIQITGETSSRHSSFWIANTASQTGWSDFVIPAGTYVGLMKTDVSSYVTVEVQDSSGSDLFAFSAAGTEYTFDADTAVKLRLYCSKTRVLPEGGVLVQPMLYRKGEFYAYVAPYGHNTAYIKEIIDNLGVIDDRIKQDVFNLKTVDGSTAIAAGTDLFTIKDPGLYHCDGNVGTLSNCPTEYTFKMIIGRLKTGNNCLIILIDSQDVIYTSAMNSYKEWKNWKMLIDEDNIGSEIFGLSGSTMITSETDFEELTTGSYYRTGAAQDIVNFPPITSSFRLWIYNRSTYTSMLAFLVTTDGKIYINAKISTGWIGWKKLMDSDSEIETGGSLPDYYKSYMDNKIKAVSALENSISANSDSFVFITDYHVKRNAGQSLLMIEEIVNRTGITKLFFGGDAYMTVTDEGRTVADAMRLAEKFVPLVYSSMQSAAPEFFSVFGNHEWNHLQAGAGENLKDEFELNFSGAYNYCLKRHESYVSEMSSEGNYYVDNKVKKIRYFFLQYDGDARPSNETINWLGDQLGVVPSGYFVFVIAHYSYIPGSMGETLPYTPTPDTYNKRMRYIPKQVQDMLHAYNTKSTFTMNFSFTANEVTKTYSGSWDYSTAPGNNVIGIISGHVHHDDVLEKSEDNILCIATTGDLYKNGSGVPYTYVDEHGETQSRTVGETSEQAFDVVHIDLENRIVYLTRFGAGLDRQYSF